MAEQDSTTILREVRARLEQDIADIAALPAKVHQAPEIAGVLGTLRWAAHILATYQPGATRAAATQHQADSDPV